jgi:hypothetical protein
MTETLQIDEDIPFQQRSWRLQRYAWIAIGVAALGAILGVFGDGPLSHAEARSASGRTTLTFERFSRRDTRTVAALKIHGAPQDRELVVRVSRPLADSIVHERFSHGVREVAQSAQHVDIAFPPSKDDVALLRFTLMAEEPGLLAGSFASNSDDPVHIQQLVYP